MDRGHVRRPDGKIPASDPAFDSHMYLRADEPRAWISMSVGERLMNNHNLIAADEADNRRMLSDLEQAINDGETDR